MNVHQFDGARGDLVRRIAPHVPLDYAHTLREVALAFPEFGDVVSALSDAVGNVDPHVPQVTAGGLCALAWRRGGSAQEHRTMWREQWADMRGGMCPQGRVTRMLQLAAAFILDEGKWE